MIKHKLLCFMTIFLLAFALRVFRLDSVDLRGDEAYSVVHWSTTPFTERWFKLWREEPAPAGAFVMYWAWNSTMGKSVFATRYLSVLGNLLGLAITVALSKRLFRRWTLALLVGLLWAVSPFMLWHSQDARIYGVQSALTTLNFWLLLRALEKPESRRRWLTYMLFQALAIYIYYFEVLWLAAQGAYVLIGHRKSLGKVFIAWIGVGVLITPVVVQAYTLLFISHYQGTASFADFWALFYQFLPTLLFGDNTWPLWAGLTIAAILLGGVGLAHGIPERGLLIAWLVIPCLLLYGLSTHAGYFNPRYAMTTAPALLIALVVVAQVIAERVSRRYLVYSGLALIFITASFFEIRDYFYFDPPKAPNWRDLTTYLKDHTTDKDTLVFGYPDPAIEYYYTGPGSIFIVPLDPTYDPKAEMDHLLARYDALYLLAGQRTRQEEVYLRQVAQFIPGDTYTGVFQFRRWKVTPGEIQVPLNVQFSDVAQLRGYTLIRGKTSGILLLYWAPLRQTSTPYSVITHIVSSDSMDGVPVAVLDHGPVSSQVTTMTWQIGMLYRDPIPLPLDPWKKGVRLAIRIGLYDAVSKQPVPISDTNEESKFHGRYLLPATLDIGP